MQIMDMALYTEILQAEKQKGTAVIVHGAGEYFARYVWLSHKLNEAGFTVIGGDLPGHGRSFGKRGHIDRFEDYYGAVDHWLSVAERQAGPVILIGHSMGGLIVTRYMQQRKPAIDGVVLSSPCLGLARKVSPVLEAAATIMNRLAPSFTLPAGITADTVSRDRAIADRYRDDPHIIVKVSVRWYKELKKAIQLALSELEEYKACPTLIMQAGDDRIVNAFTTRAWAQRLPVEDKQYYEWAGLFHEIFNEPEKESVVQYLLEWMEKIKHRR
ncbi:alpha/beta hydrolase [Aneurinibacillus sp. Ricciae_BoGa-3]|uniref:alpha/beta hydrolase n=1 Tax=Aneurinibacillus sp. Ricciae_BoGa-3 TaxID=3022697 RepID=UPI0023415959|nr:alpha/beta hydrolase [Aneurinibacillus sp. Ricciae_BoGa-3]WCK55608.1 alpha/beta hydrolase [Aneurinibacillus sp. Ricciae_BoGa-3]